MEMNPGGDIFEWLPSPGGGLYVSLGFDKTSPSLMMPMPNLLALPSKPREMTMVMVFSQ